MQSFLISLALASMANAAVLWLLVQKVPEMISVNAGIVPVLVLGLLVALMNVVVRPVLNILTLPLKLFATILAIIIVNGLFVQILVVLVQALNLPWLTLSIGGGLLGWVTVALALGFANWVTKLLAK